MNQCSTTGHTFSDGATSCTYCGAARRCDECGDIEPHLRFVDDKLRTGYFCATCVPRNVHATKTRRYMTNLWQWECSCGASRLGYPTGAGCDDAAKLHRETAT